MCTNVCIFNWMCGYIYIYMHICSCICSTHIHAYNNRCMRVYVSYNSSIDVKYNLST
jgi:hypothetical protein